jgi:3-oxoacyl-[acyl-carrier-protein] synthase-3
MYVPPKVLTNADLERMVDTSDEWIVQRTGIRRRHIVEGDTGVLELSTHATRQALQAAGIQPADLDLLICATITPEMVCPATACRIVDALGARPCGAMDISAACTGFIAGLNIASSLIRTGMYQHIAVIGAEALSTITDWDDRRTCVLFGDGAGAAILSATDDAQRGCIYQSLGSDGSKWNELYCPQQPRDLPGEGAPFTGKYDTLQMNGREIYKFAVVQLQKSIEEALAAAQLTLDQVKVIIPHQSNSRILESARDRLRLPEEKMYINIDRYGNTSAASVGICLHELTAAGRIQRGDDVIFVGLGGGLTWGSSVWRI